jgi:hypothetical protein
MVKGQMIERGLSIQKEKMIKIESSDSRYNHIYHLYNLTDRKPVRQSRHNEIFYPLRLSGEPQENELSSGILNAVIIPMTFISTL